MLKNSFEHIISLNFFFSFQLSSPFISVYINKSLFSNLAARAELGRLPLRHNIIVAQLKYFARAKLINNSELLAQAMISQGKLLKNSYNTFTYTQLCENLLNELGLQHICSPNRPIKIDTYMKQYGGLVKEKSIA